MKDFYSDMSFFDRFTKTADAVKHIQYFENLNLEDIDELALEKSIDEKFKIFPYTSCFIPEGSELFRARINIDRKPFLKVKDIETPPPDLIKKYGRANKPGEQIFYCATNYGLAAFEVLQDFKNSISPENEIAFLTIGVWKTLKPLNVLNIIESPVLHDIRDDIKKDFENQKYILTKYHFNNEIVEANNLISQFFANQFTKSKIESHHDYKISALYTRRLKIMNSFISEEYTDRKFDGVNYPSIAMKYNGDNQALFIENIEKKLTLVNAIQVVCSNFNFEKPEFLGRIIREAESIVDGEIIWKKEFYSP
jgi:hypothetical protein